MPYSIKAMLGGTKLIPVVEITNPENAVPLAKTLCEAGLPVIEITLRTKTAMEAVRNVVREVPDCLVGVGSILSKEQLIEAKKSGAHFGVSPGSAPSLVAAIKDLDWPFLPGASTVSEVMTLREQSFFEQKLFPAEQVGGTAFLKALSGPVGDVSFCPTGGIKPETLSSYLKLPNVFTAGGSWIAPRTAIEEEDWQGIFDRAQAASQV